MTLAYRGKKVYYHARNTTLFCLGLCVLACLYNNISFQIIRHLHMCQWLSMFKSFAEGFLLFSQPQN